MCKLGIGRLESLDNLYLPFSLFMIILRERIEYGGHMYGKPSAQSFFKPRFELQTLVWKLQTQV